MATAVAPAGGNITALKSALYEACLQEAAGEDKTVFHQNSIFELDIIPGRDVLMLLRVAQQLVDEKLFKPVNDISGLGWMLRTADEARKYRSLTTEQEIVYAIIDESGEDGVWTKTIKIRSNLHDAVYKASIKFLEGKNMITDMKSVEHPTRKMYIKTGARLSDRATGGPWFTDGVLDEEFIAQVMKILHGNIFRRTFYHSSAPRVAKKSSSKKLSVEEAKALRAQGLDPEKRILREENDNDRVQRNAHLQRYLPMPVGYGGYPTLQELTEWVDNTKAFSQTLTAPDIEQLLQILIYDDKIEKLIKTEGVVYRALRKEVDFNANLVAKPFIEAPCGRCPVFDLCEEGGPVGPSNCEYFDKWLGLEF